MHLDVEEVVDVLQDHIALVPVVKEAAALGHQLPMDVHISFREVYVMHLHSHRSARNAYLVSTSHPLSKGG